MEKPDLRQFGDLTLEDFDRHPVWIGCHTADNGEPWYEDTDEETFRPWTGNLPAGATEGMFLVKATIELADGSRHPGFVTPAVTPGDLGAQQPQIFAGGRRVRFWGGIRGVPVIERQALYGALGRDPDAIFPLKFSVDPRLATGETGGEVSGFYRFVLRDGTRLIEL